MKRFTDSNVFLEHVEAVLMEEELLNNLPLGVLYRLIEDDRSPNTYFLASVDEGDQPLLIMLQTQSHLILSASSDAASEKLAACCDAAAAYISHLNDVHIPGIIGIRPVADAFAEAWQRNVKQDYETEMDQRVYGCSEVKSVPVSPGYFRMAAQSDAALITEWIQEFCEEALGGISEKAAEEMALSGINRSAIVVWEDGGPVSMAQKTRPTRHGAVVNMVYTPRRFRGKGYASSCVAALTRSILDGPGKFASLYTDLSNPVSNRIYMNIGYEPLADSVVYVFREHASS